MSRNHALYYLVVVGIAAGLCVLGLFLLHIFSTGEAR